MQKYFDLKANFLSDSYKIVEMFIFGNLYPFMHASYKCWRRKWFQEYHYMGGARDFSQVSLFESKEKFLNNIVVGAS